jgi:hypothetical protein
MSSARRTPVPQNAGDTQYNVRDAALLGASSAFSKPPVKPKPLVNTYTGGSNGALLAATKVGTGNTRSTPGSNTTSPLRKNWTGGSYGFTSRPNLLSKSSSSTLEVPDDLSDRTPSPSNIAAKLAAARYSPMPIKPIKFIPIPKMSEKEADTRNALPPTGSVSNVLARLNSESPGQQLKRRDNTGSGSVASIARAPKEEHKPTDSTPIPPTTSLVSMFEQKRPSTPTKQSAEPLAVSRNAPPQIRSPKPQRKFKVPSELSEEAPLERKRTRTPPPPKPKPAHIRTLSIDGSGDANSSVGAWRASSGTYLNKHKPAQLTAIKTTSPRSSPPIRRSSRQTRPKSEDLTRSPTAVHRQFSTSASLHSNDAASSPTSFVSAQEEQEQKPRKPSLPPPRRSTKRRSRSAHGDTQTKTSSVPPRSRLPSGMTSPLQVPERFPRSASVVPSSPPSDSLFHSHYQRESIKQITKHMTGESLSNAIVGAALASSRTHSPALSGSIAPPVLSSRKHQHHLPLHYNRSPSPPKTAPGKLRTTLRKDPSSSSDEDESERYKRKGTRIMGIRKKHPNKHHEGTRKRWRDIVTERERKRYEGVWAANKGLHIPPQPPSRNSPNEDSIVDVLHLVTRELWQRSRLPEHELEEVWDLVDSRGVGRLRREEFVVGMWLIDQRLKGRKLPVRVSDSVWGSVRNPAGVKIRVKR